MGDDVLDCRLVLEPCEYISSLKFVDLTLGVLLDELIDVHESTTDSDQDLVPTLHLDMNPLLPKVVHPLTLTQEHNLHPIGFRASGVDILRQLVVNLVSFMPNVNGLAFF